MHQRNVPSSGLSQKKGVSSRPEESRGGGRARIAALITAVAVGISASLSGTDADSNGFEDAAISSPPSRDLFRRPSDSYRFSTPHPIPVPSRLHHRSTPQRIFLHPPLPLLAHPPSPGLEEIPPRPFMSDATSVLLDHLRDLCDEVRRDDVLKSFTPDEPTIFSKIDYQYRRFAEAASAEHLSSSSYSFDEVCMDSEEFTALGRQYIENVLTSDDLTRVEKYFILKNLPFRLFGIDLSRFDYADRLSQEGFFRLDPLLPQFELEMQWPFNLDSDNFVDLRNFAQNIASKIRDKDFHQPYAEYFSDTLFEAYQLYKKMYNDSSMNFAEFPFEDYFGIDEEALKSFLSQRNIIPQLRSDLSSFLVAYDTFSQFTFPAASLSDANYAYFLQQRAFLFYELDDILTTLSEFLLDPEADLSSSASWSDLLRIVEYLKPTDMKQSQFFFDATASSQGSAMVY